MPTIIYYIISDPVSPVPAPLDCLGEFGRISGYKVSKAKSQALMLIGERPKDLDKIVSFNWPTQGFKYLGVMITPQSSQLFTENYGKRISNTKLDLYRW